ncbi:hypothetical protein C7M52_01801 [Mixta theicola]|nr:hypothetical protein C7M52_01801 [Mixta theicola]
MHPLKFCCPGCGSHQFIFTQSSRTCKMHHGAICASCRLPLTQASCFAGLLHHNGYNKGR